MRPLAKHGISALAALAGKAVQAGALRQMTFNAIRLKRKEVERVRSLEEARFLAYCFVHRDQSRSQILQDLWVSYMLGEKRGGFFVEFGATDGLTNSNTWLLERKYGWMGILAEPNPLWRPALVENRQASIDTRCVSSASGRTVEFLVTDSVDPELSGLAEFASGDHFANVRLAGQAIEVETVSLNELLEEHGAPAHIDYLSIDTEGSELEILRGFDFSRQTIDLISVEQNRQTELDIDDILTRNGYARVFRELSQWDGWYVRAGLRPRS